MLPWMKFYRLLVVQQHSHSGELALEFAPAQEVGPDHSDLPRFVIMVSPAQISEIMAAVAKIGEGK